MNAHGNLDHVVVRLGERGDLGRKYFAIKADGTISTPGEAAADFSSLHREDFGALTLASARLIVRSAQSMNVNALIWLEPDAEPTAFAETWNERGISARASERMHAVFAQLPTELAIELARNPVVRKLSLEDSRPPLPFGVPPPASIPSSARTSYAHSAYNDDGYFADGITVGVTEAAAFPILVATKLEEMAVLFPHEAFGTNTVLHQFSPAGCQVDSECSSFAVSPGDIVRCIDGACTNEHLLAVVSRIASTQSGSNCSGPCLPGQYQAAEANLHIAGIQYTSGSPQFVKEAYEWLAGDSAANPPRPKAHIVNESWGPLATGLRQRDQLTDWFSRHEGMTFVQAAGNSVTLAGTPRPIPPAGFEDPTDQEVACAGVNSICVGAARFVGGPDSISSTELDIISRWGNPTRGGSLAEIEKPDVVAESADTTIPTTAFGHTARLTTSSSDVDEWDENYLAGTSFAAPVVSGLLALNAEYCFDTENFIPGRLWNRAVLRTSTWNAINPGDPLSLPHCIGTLVSPGTPAYPTAQIDLTDDVSAGCDYKLGTGVVNGENLKRFCGPGGPCEDPNGAPCPQVGSGTGSVVPGDGTPVGGTSRPNPGEYFDSATPIGFSEASLRTFDSPGARLVKLAEFGASDIGRRVRASLAYNSCPGGSMQSVGPFASPNVVNFDLALCGKRRPANGGTPLTCEFLSESLDDTNEGFDVQIKSDYDELDLYLVAEDTWEACDAVGGGPVAGTTSDGEPYAWAWAVW